MSEEKCFLNNAKGANLGNAEAASRVDAQLYDAETVGNGVSSVECIECGSAFLISRDGIIKAKDKVSCELGPQRYFGDSSKKWIMNLDIAKVLDLAA